MLENKRFCKLHDNGQGAWLPLSNFPLRHDRKTSKGKYAYHTYCRQCKSQYETYRRLLSGMRALARSQRVMYDLDSAPKLSINVDAGLDLEYRAQENEFWIHDQQHGDAYVRLDENQKHKLIVLLGGVVVPDD